MHTESLTPAATKLFPALSAFKERFYLAGGTGLALQIGHRISVDFDLFSNDPIRKVLLKQVEDLFDKETHEVLTNNGNELTMIIDGVKVTFLHYPFPIIKPLNTSGPIPMLTVEEILVAKAYTIGRRGELKDYIDIYTGLKRKFSTLTDMISLAQKKYGDAFNDRLFLEQIVYLDYIEEIKITMLKDAPPSKGQLIQFFSECIKTERLV